MKRYLQYGTVFHYIKEKTGEYTLTRTIVIDVQHGLFLDLGERSLLETRLKPHRHFLFTLAKFSIPRQQFPARIKVTITLVPLRNERIKFTWRFSSVDGIATENRWIVWPIVECRPADFP